IRNVSSPYTHSGLANGTTYYYVVTARNAIGEGPESNIANATPGAVTNAETEPNDNFTQSNPETLLDTTVANTTNTNNTVTGQIGGATRADVDWFRMVVGQTGMVTITLTANNAPVAADLDLNVVDG